MSPGESDAPGQPVTEVAFTLTDAEYPFLDVAATEECRLEMVRLLPRGEDRYAKFFSVDGADPATVADRVAERPAVTAHLLARHNGGGLFEFVDSRRGPVVDLAHRGAIPTTVVGEDGTGFIRAEIPTPHESSTLVGEFLEEFPAATLVSKRETGHPTPLVGGTELRHVLSERLTDRQHQVLEAAYENGYYERPRRASGQDLADELDISLATFSQHLRAAERKLLGLIYESEED